MKLKNHLYLSLFPYRNLSWLNLIEFTKPLTWSFVNQILVETISLLIILLLGATRELMIVLIFTMFVSMRNSLDLFTFFFATQFSVFFNLYYIFLIIIFTIFWFVLLKFPSPFCPLPHSQLAQLFAINLKSLQFSIFHDHGIFKMHPWNQTDVYIYLIAEASSIWLSASHHNTIYSFCYENKCDCFVAHMVCNHVCWEKKKTSDIL